MNLYYNTKRKHASRRSWFSKWTSGWFAKRNRRFTVESLEQRQLLAADLFAISRASFMADGHSAPIALESSSQDLFIAPPTLAPQSIVPAAGERVRIRLETQSLDETAITSIAPGNEFVLRAYVSDLRATPQGVFSAFVDVTYDQNLVNSQSGSGDGVANEAPYTSGTSGNAQTPGLINEAGGNATSVTPIGGGEKLLFTVLMKANVAGSATFTLDPADVAGNDISVYGEDLAVPLEEVEFVNTTLTIGTPQPTLSISDVQVTEQDDQVSIAELTVTLSSAGTQPITVDYATVAGTAVAGADFEAIQNASLIFLAGETSKTISIPVLADNAAEGNETFTVVLSNPFNATIADGIGTVTIADDDAPPPTISISDVSKAEGDSGNTAFDFVVTLSAAASGPVTVDFATLPGTATAGTDYTTATGTVTFAAGETSKTVTVQVIGDEVDEEAETFVVVLSNAVGGTIADNSGQGTITNDDSPIALPTLAIGDASVSESDSGFVDVVFNVTLSAASTTNVTVNFATASGTATSGTDFEAKTGTVTFAPGETTKTITVRAIGDTTDEPNETFVVDLTSPVGATITDAQATGTINDDDETPLPTYSIDDVALAEGNSGNTAFEFTVTLSAASSSVVTIDYNTVSGTATAGTDFTAANGTVTFQPGETTKKFTINVLGDTAFEPAETFTVTLSNATSAAIGDNTGLGTINNDDEQGPAFSVADAVVAEGNTGTVNATFTVTLSEALSTQATVNYATVNGTAIAPGDYTSTSGTLTFAAGETSKTVTVVVAGDALDEANETFKLVLSNVVGASIDDGEATGTINDDDATPTLTINNRTVDEEDTGVRGMAFTVTLSAASGQTVTVKYATADGTAKAGEDYTQTTGTLTFPAGTTTRTINVPIRGDSTDESNEKFTITLSEPTNATIADGTGEGTITDNDAEPKLSIGDVTVTEGDNGTTNAVFTVTLSAISGLPVIVDYATVAGTALAGSDFTATSGELTFNPGETTKTITVPIVGDTISEGTETFTVKLTAPTFATLLDDTGTGTITDNEALPTLAIGNVTVAEGDSGTQNAVFTVTLTGSSTGAVTVAYATANGTAVAGTDYTSTTGTLTFAAGETTKTISVPIGGDEFAENNETFLINLSNAVGATIATAQGTGTITNDDDGPIDGEESSVAGSVYIDVNQNGFQDANESGIANVTIRLTGTDQTGRPVDLTTTTNAAGDYIFANLAAGQYTLTETHPTSYMDGQDSVGSSGGTTAADQFFFTLGAAQNGTEYNFGEAGLTPGNITRRNFIVPG